LLLYYITDRSQFPGSEAERCEQLLHKVREAVAAAVDYIQLRERDLSGRGFEELARGVAGIVGEKGSQTRLLINSRTDIALSTASDGVNLRSQDISPSEVRRIWRAANSRSEPVVAVSCHAEEEVRSASSAGADFVVFGPVFGKGEAPGTGLAALKAACGHKIPVLALGGVTLENAGLCLARGAAGVAGIRLFQQGDLENTVQRLRQ
jgi:thiamine-phosphate pyrophosphorylase